MARERYGLGFGTTMGTSQTTFRCRGEWEPSSDMSDDSDGDGEVSWGRRGSAEETEETSGDVRASERGDGWSIGVPYGWRRRGRGRRSLRQWAK